ncbi:MAG: TetR/AcrR family transcriptional regulator [Anaerolineae bacterium]|nr:TetR/AcrR family transcriptional regulator [Anaerolineae bacterium]
MNSQQQRAEETRNRILAAAEERFAQYGYDATSVAEICRQAGVTKGGFYHHFSSKQAVFLELLDQWLGMLDTLLVTYHDAETPVADELLQIAGMIRHVFREASGRLPMFLEFWNKAAHDSAIWQVAISPYRRYRDFFARLIEAGIANDEFQAVDSDVFAQLIVSLAVGVILQGLMDPHGGDWGKAMHEGMRIILEGIKKREE